MQKHSISRAVGRPLMLAVLVCAIAGALVGQDGAVRIPTSEALKLATHKVSPQYPDMARQMNLTGAVELDAVINEEGKVESVKIVKGNPILTGAAQQALKSWKFKPIEREGKPVKASAAFAFNFIP